MKQYILILILFACSLLTATTLQTFSCNSSTLQAHFEGLRQEPVLLEEIDTEVSETVNNAIITKTLAFPFAEAELQISTMLWNVFDTQGNYLYNEWKNIENAVSLVHGFTFREMRGYTIRIETQITENNIIRTLKELNFTLMGYNPVQIPASLSPAFIDAYKALADNFTESYLRDIPFSRPKMLIITHSQLTNYQNDFIAWKKSLGFEVYTVNKSDIGSTAQDIKNYIAIHYQTYKWDHLFLWGDVTGTYSIPTNYITSPEYAENDADDNYYTMLEGDDYFPEMLVGRFSFANASEFITMTNKTILQSRL